MLGSLTYTAENGPVKDSMVQDSLEGSTTVILSTVVLTLSAQQTRQAVDILGSE